MLPQLKVGLAVFFLVDCQPVVEEEEQVFFETVYLEGCVGFDQFCEGVVFEALVVPDF